MNMFIAKSTKRYKENIDKVVDDMMKWWHYEIVHDGL